MRARIHNRFASSTTTAPMCVLLLAARPRESLERRGGQVRPVRKFSRRDPGEKARKARRKAARIGGEGNGQRAVIDAAGRYVLQPLPGQLRLPHAGLTEGTVMRIRLTVPQWYRK
jgi:hypothetical protein